MTSAISIRRGLLVWREGSVVVLIVVLVVIVAMVIVLVVVIVVMVMDVAWL